MQPDKCKIYSAVVVNYEQKSYHKMLYNFI